MPVNIAKISRTVVHRAWHDVEPKIQTGLLTGAVVTAGIAEAGGLGIQIDPTLAALLTAVASFVGGWLKASDARDWDFGDAPAAAAEVPPAAPAADFTAV